MKAAAALLAASLFNYGLVPAAVVLAHPDGHPEREMHGGARRGASHIVLALFDGETRLSAADVTMHVTLAGGSGLYRIRFDVRRPGAPGVTSAQFEHRVSPEGRR